jgi:hypothetical protein
MEGAKELYAQAEARVDTTIKQQEELNVKATTMAQREQVVADRELKLQEREEQDECFYHSNGVSVPAENGSNISIMCFSLTSPYNGLFTNIPLVCFSLRSSYM